MEKSTNDIELTDGDELDDQEFEVDRLHDASLSASWADPFRNILSVAANWGEGAGRLESLKV